MDLNADGELLSYLTGQAEEAEARQRTLMARLKLMGSGAVPVAQAPLPEDPRDCEDQVEEQPKSKSKSKSPKAKSPKQQQQRSPSESRSKRGLGSACLQCRSTHDRCDPGETPDSVCALCARREKTCSIVTLDDDDDDDDGDDDDDTP